MNEMDGTREARAEAAPPFDSVERAPLAAESRQQGGEFSHGADADDGRLHLKAEIGEAAVHEYTEVPGEPMESAEPAEAAEARAETDDEGDVYDIWDRRNETSGSINLRNFGR